MSTADALKALGDALSNVKVAIETAASTRASELADAKAALLAAQAKVDDLTGKDAQDASLRALADGITLLMRGEAWVASKTPNQFRTYVWAAAGAVMAIAGGAAWYLLR